MRELGQHLRAFGFVVVTLTVICVWLLSGYDSLNSFGIFMLKMAIGVAIGCGITAAGELLVRLADRRESPRKAEPGDIGVTIDP